MNEGPKTFWGKVAYYGMCFCCFWLAIPTLLVLLAGPFWLPHWLVHVLLIPVYLLAFCGIVVVPAYGIWASLREGIFLKEFVLVGRAYLAWGALVAVPMVVIYLWG